jgi:UDP-N-acetylmuramoyl-tripeptide--D-alanyl-D-alanine ligase
MSIPELHKVFLESDGICTDTRKLKQNQLYFALKGENFNGNKFAQQALESGALKAIIDEETFKNAQTIIVDDVLETLQKLATYHRNYLNIFILFEEGFL